MNIENIENILNSYDNVIIAMGLLLTVVGWFAVFILNSRQQKKNLKNQAMMKVYEDIYDLYEEVVKSFSIDLSVQFGGSVSIVFITMGGAEKGVHPKQPYVYWLDYISQLSEKHFIAQENIAKLRSRLDAWFGVVPKLQMAKDNLFKELYEFDDEIRKHTSYLYSKDVIDWKKWEKEVKDNSKVLYERLAEIAMFLEDFMGLMHDELISPIVGFKKRERDLRHVKKEITYRALTKKGIEEKKHKPE